MWRGQRGGRALLRQVWQAARAAPAAARVLALQHGRPPPRPAPRPAHPALVPASAALREPPAALRPRPGKQTTSGLRAAPRLRAAATGLQCAAAERATVRPARRVPAAAPRAVPARAVGAGDEQL